MIDHWAPKPHSHDELILACVATVVRTAGIGTYKKKKKDLINNLEHSNGQAITVLPHSYEQPLRQPSAIKINFRGRALYTEAGWGMRAQSEDCLPALYLLIGCLEDWLGNEDNFKSVIPCKENKVQRDKQIFHFVLMSTNNMAGIRVLNIWLDGYTTGNLIAKLMTLLIVCHP